VKNNTPPPPIKFNILKRDKKSKNLKLFGVTSFWLKNE
jgi:hypothetical protein